jgi:hypothetical protein
MDSSAEDGGAPPMVLAQDHGEQDPGERDHGERAAAASEPPRRRPTDGFAVASLISGLLALIPLTVIFGPVALSRIARTGARGRALAIIGLVLGGMWAVAAVVAIAVILTHPRPAARPIALPKVFSLRTGECINSPASGFAGVRVLACGQPHDGEVFGTFRLTGQSYPGAGAVRQKAIHGCAGRLSGYVNPQLSTMLSESYAYPDSGAWGAGERTVVCTVRGTDGTLIGSVRTAPG